MPGCRSCLFSGLEPATHADGYRQDGRFVRTCALRIRRPAARHACASHVPDPGEELSEAALRQALRVHRPTPHEPERIHS